MASANLLRKRTERMVLGIHDVGCKRGLKVDMFTRSSAIFGGASKEYRYVLDREWGGVLGTVMFLMMNPSVADIDVNDATVAKCQRYAQAWNFDRLLVGNTFAYRATDQKRLLEVTDPVGPDNDHHLVEMARRSHRIVFAYGMPHASLRYRGPEVVKLLAKDGHGAKIHALKLCADGTPSHPLYLKADLQGFRWGLPRSRTVNGKIGASRVTAREPSIDPATARS